MESPIADFGRHGLLPAHGPLGSPDDSMDLLERLVAHSSYFDQMAGLVDPLIYYDDDMNGSNGLGNARFAKVRQQFSVLCAVCGCEATACIARLNLPRGVAYGRFHAHQ